MATLKADDDDQADNDFARQHARKDHVHVGGDIKGLVEQKKKQPQRSAVGRLLSQQQPAQRRAQGEGIDR
jgi:hypothetical protein